MLWSSPLIVNLRAWAPGSVFDRDGQMDTINQGQRQKDVKEGGRGETESKKELEKEGRREGDV